MEKYRNEINDPRTSQERKKELESEIQKFGVEMEASNQMIFSAEKKLQDVAAQNEGT